MYQRLYVFGLLKCLYNTEVIKKNTKYFLILQMSIDYTLTQTNDFLTLPTSGGN